MPRISVCLTHYNRPDKLGATLESLALQTRVPDEVFVWDDCSPNDPIYVIEEWKARFPHFVYHRNDVNLGMPGNLNAVIAQATGDYVANLHDADVFAPTLLEKWESALETHPKAVLAFCRDSRWLNPRFVAAWADAPALVTPGREFFERFYLGRLDSIIWGTVMMRREIYQKLLPFNSLYKNWADVDMWMRACGEGGVTYVPELLIELDNTPAAHRLFSFRKLSVTQVMITANIKRLYVGKALKLALQKQKKAWRIKWLRWLLVGFYRLDFKRIREAFNYISP
jgi:glycosyltransferase involved in cell wall biosynthesis